MNKRQAFTLIETLGGMALAGILVALLITVISSVRGKTHSITCAANLRQWGILFQQYIGDHDGYLPLSAPFADGKTWNYFNAPVPQYLNLPLSAATDWQAGKNINGCPAHVDRQYDKYFRTRYYSYVYNYHLGMVTANDGSKTSLKMINIHNASRLFMITDAVNDANAPATGFSSRLGQQENIGHPHDGGKCNVLFLDGHIESVKDWNVNENLKPALP